MRGSRVLGVLALMLACAVAALIAGCGSGGGETSGGPEAPAKRGGTLRIAPQFEAATLLPVKAATLPEAQILSQVLQGLFTINPENNKVEPLLAERVEKSADLREWTFHLRDGVKFSSGKPLTAADVIFTLETAKESESYGNLFEGIEELSAPDDLTVALKTDAPAPALPSILSIFSAGIVPDNYGGETAQQFGSAPVGTGPFAVSSWNRGRQLTLERNPHYWQKGLPLLDEVVYVNAPTDVGRAQQLRAAEVDLITEPAFSQLKSLEETPGFRSFKGEDAQIGFVLLNTKKALFADLRAREAVNLALNREDMNEAGWKGYGQVAASYFPLSMLYVDKSLKPPAQDVARARKLLAEAVAATGEQPNFTQLTETGSETGLAVSQVMQENLKEIGMKASIQQLDASSWIEQVATGNYDLTFLNSTSNLPDPVEQVSFYTQTEGLWTGATNVPQIKRLEQEALTEIDPKQREVLYRQIQQKIYDDNDLLMVNNVPTVWVATDDVSGLAISSTGIYDLREVGFSE